RLDEALPRSKGLLPHLRQAGPPGGPMSAPPEPPRRLLEGGAAGPGDEASRRLLEQLPQAPLDEVTRERSWRKLPVAEVRERSLPFSGRWPRLGLVLAPVALAA